MDKYYHLLTYGCQMNEADSETLAGMLEMKGYQYIADESKADIILLITCAIREHAEQRVYGKLGELMNLKRKNPALIIGIGGCMTQQESVYLKLKQKFPQLDIIFGTHNLHDFPALLEKAEKSKQTVAEVWEKETEICEGLPKARKSNFQAWVNITFGCNNFCTYCIVPYVRGRERSRNPEDIKAEVMALAKDGYKEICLLGQNVNSYGKDLANDVDFAALLQQLTPIEGIERIRFMTPHPRDMTPKLLKVIAGEPKICKHIHLPLQSGSNTVLRRMNRGYTREHYLELAQKIRTMMPEASITTDIIVGFPGETAEDFGDTLDVVRQVKYDAAYTFAYSPRKGTRAATMPDQIPEAVKKERLHQLIDEVTHFARQANQRLLHTTQMVMVEGPSKKDPEVLSGRTDNNKLVHFRGKYSPGEMLEVQITKAQSFLLWGEPTKKE